MHSNKRKRSSTRLSPTSQATKELDWWIEVPPSPYPTGSSIRELKSNPPYHPSAQSRLESPCKKSRTSANDRLPSVVSFPRQLSPTFSDAYPLSSSSKFRSRVHSPSPTFSTTEPDPPFTSASGISTRPTSPTYSAYDSDEDATGSNLPTVNKTEAELSECLGESSGHRREIPIRRLDLMRMYDEEGQSVSPEEVVFSGRTCFYLASGIVSAVVDDGNIDDGEEDAEDEVRVFVKDLHIVSLNVHHFDSESETFDRHIYIETNEAWYRLDEPSADYEDLWLSFLRKQRACNDVLLDCLQNDSETDLDVSQWQGKDHREAYRLYVTQVLYYLSERQARPACRFFRTPLVAGLVEGLVDIGALKNPAQGTKRVIKDITKGGIKTPLTAMVWKQVHSLVPCTTVSVGDEDDTLSELEPEEMDEHPDNPDLIRLDGDCDEWGRFSEAEIDGTIYKIGDIVAVKCGDDDDRHRHISERASRSYCVNAFAQDHWFCVIRYFYEDDNETMLHGQWFQHSSRIFFQDFAHSQELVYLNECADLSVQSIFQKAQVRILDADDLEWPDRSDPASRVYFCRSIYDDTAHSLESLEERDREELRGEHDALECKNCHRKEYLDKFDSTQLLTRTEDSMVVTGFEHYLVQYHLNEFVFIKPEKRSDDPKKTDKTQLLLIAHILQINPKREKVLIQRYRRAVSRVFNERGLLKSKDKPMWIHFEQVESKCFVKFFEPDQLSGVEEWIEEDYTHFYVAACEDSPEKPLCEECLDNEEQNNQKTRTFFDKHKLRGMEVFAGAGGLSLGLEEGKGIEIKWAVELDASAAKTFAANHPASAVLCVDIKKLLRYVVDRRDHKSPDPLRTEAGQVIDDKLIPHPGQVDFLCGGPPCQSFSGANRFKRDNDERSMLPFVMLSLAEVYRPKYFLLENVTGLLYHKLSSPTTKQVIPMGTFKLIMRVLHALRFQVQAKVVQAGQYGVPQYRERVIFLAARNDAKLPSFPTPITTFVKGRKYKLSHQDQAFLRAPTRDPGPDVEEDSYAPHCRVTVRDVISDLPLWEWAGFQRQEQDADIVTFDASVKPLMAPPIGYHQPVGYAGPPQTPYQKALRASGSKRVRDHVTNYYSARLLTLCAHIPLSSKSNPLPCYEDLPKSLNYKLKGGMSYGRLNEASYFSTAMTIVNPSSKGARLLHPNLNRVVTVLEAKRSQGFPDDFVLESVETVPRLRVKDFYRQIGNAVPVKLGAAFGRSIGAAFYIDHSDGEAAEGRATNERVPSPEY